MPRSITAYAAVCYWSASAEDEQWWDGSQFVSGPEPGDTVDFNDKVIRINANIDFGNYTIQGYGSVIVDYGYEVIVRGQHIFLNYGTLYMYSTAKLDRLEGGTVYVMSPDADIYDYSSGQIYIANPQQIKLFSIPIYVYGGTNVVPGNIKKDVMILGVTGTMQAGGGLLRAGD
jgi:hypothetical protein